MQNNTTDTLKMTSNERQIEVQTDFDIGLTRLDRQYNTQRRPTQKKKEKPPLRIFENFFQRAFGTIAKPHKPPHNPSFAKEPNFTNAQNIHYMNKTLIILTLLLNSCMTGKQITNTGVKQVHFGSGGGFTGIENIYVLDKDGSIKDKDQNVVNELRKKEVLSIFENAKELADSKLNQPENMYSFITIISESDTNRLVWGQETSKVSPNILTLHGNLMNKIKTNK